MTKLLAMALTKVAELPDAEQDRSAQLVLDEVEDEAPWQATFAGSQDKLARLAQRARWAKRDLTPFPSLTVAPTATLSWIAS